MWRQWVAAAYILPAVIGGSNGCRTLGAGKICQRSPRSPAETPLLSPPVTLRRCNYRRLVCLSLVSAAPPEASVGARAGVLLLAQRGTARAGVACQPPGATAATDNRRGGRGRRRDAHLDRNVMTDRSRRPGGPRGCGGGPTAPRRPCRHAAGGAGCARASGCGRWHRVTANGASPCAA